MKVRCENESKRKGDGGKKKAYTRLTKVKGIVVPVAWDEDGKEVAFAISTYEEEHYRITKDDKGKKLEALIREEVEVIGEVNEHENKKMISIKKCYPEKSLKSTASSQKKREGTKKN
jgi:hypothetical protein